MPRFLDSPRLRQVANLSDLIAYLRDELGWPIAPDTVLEDLTFDWSGADIRLSDNRSVRLKDGAVRQLRPFVPGQPWGIFLVEFADTQVYRTSLRQILRGLVPNRRRDPALQSWQHENLLFICATAEYDRFTFAHFKGDKLQRAKLATFGWRKGSAYLRTLIEHNLPHLNWPRDDGADPKIWQSEWARAFDKEPVTKKFFDDFNDTFRKVCNDIANRHSRWSKETVEREAQTLLNRLLFLYFIQRKGWLNRDRQYLVNQFRDHYRNDPTGTSFQKDFLQKLFVKLSTKGPQADIPGHDLPFLNGGLFADEYGTEQRDDEVRRHHELKVGNDTFQHIFDDLLEAYNFTVREDTPLDVDVAIDPEMLGKIFESLVLQLEQSEVGGKSSRHDTGSYYTPRPIVHYLCRDALAAWLADQPHLKVAQALTSGIEAPPPGATHPADGGHTNTELRLVDNLLSLDASQGLDETTRATLNSLLTPSEARALAEALQELRACDPAVGSGAFPVALLHELVNVARLAETRARGKDPAVNDPRWLFDAKTRFIERVLYGVDIQARAIEICKLRLWLSLVVDYPLDVDVNTCEKQSFRDALKRLPALPNLDFKIRRANSLIDMIHGEPVPLGKLHAGEKARLPLNRLITSKREFYSADSVPEKRKLRFAIYEATAELAQIELTAARNQLGLIPDPDNAEKVAELDQGQKEMGKVLGHIRDARKMRAADQDEALERLREFFDDENKPTFVWQLDFAEVFHREKNPRFDLIIGNPPYVRIQVLSQVDPKQVAWFKDHYVSASKGNYDLYVIFVERGLQLLQPKGQLAFILPHKFFNAQYGEPLRELLSKGQHLRHVIHFGDQQIFPGATNYVCLLFLANAGARNGCNFLKVYNLALWISDFQGTAGRIPPSEIGKAEWNFVVGKDAAIYSRLKAMQPTLGSLADRISQGIRTSANEIYVLEVTARRRNEVVAKSQRLQKEVAVESAAVSDFLEGESIKPFRILPCPKVVIIPYRRGTNRTELIPAQEYKRTLPKTWEYLQENKTELKSREDSRMDHEGWYGFIYPKNLDLMRSPKLLVPDIAANASFALDEAGHYAFTSGYGITLNPTSGLSLKLVLGLCNSRVLDFFWRKVSTPLRGGFYRYFTQHIEQFPIPTCSPEQQSQVERLVDWLVWLRNQSSVTQSSQEHPRDPLIATYFEQWLNALAYELYFPDDLHSVGLAFFSLSAQHIPPAVDSTPSGPDLPHIRDLFERLYDINHPLRAALFSLGSLEIVRTIEGKE